MPSPVLALLALGMLGLVAGCSLAELEGRVPRKPVSVQKLEYYPYQVKGYQKTYPARSFVVLMPTDERAHREAGPDAPAGKIPVGVLTNKSDKVVQRLYADPLPAIVQHAIYQSADEAGFNASLVPQTSYASGRYPKAAYVLTTRIEHCWVKKHLSVGGPDGSFWSTTARFALKLALYKPPFSIPFWQGASSSTYHDPPVGSFGLGPEDEVAIYDHPGQDLSVALTRAVAGIFEHRDLHTLIVNDHVLKH